MNKGKFSIETCFLVFDDTEGVSIAVRQDGDAIGLVELATNHNEESSDYFGEISLRIHPDMARLVGRALIKQADLLSSDN